MQRYSDWYRDSEGRGYPGAVVTVYNAGTSVKPQLYNAGGSISSPAPIANPTFTDSNGYFAFAIPNGTYDIHLQGGGMPETIIQNKVIGTTDITSIPASAVSTIAPLTGAVTRSQQSQNNDVVSLADFGAVGDGVTDDTAAVQAAAMACATSKKTLFVPTPSVGYLISSKVDVSCSMLGETPTDPVTGIAQFLTKNNINVFNIYGFRLRIENIGVRYSIATLATSAAIGFLFGNSTSQFSRSIVRNCFVRYAYDSFKANTTGAVGTLWMNRFENCSSDLHVHYGFDFLCVAGSTTLMLDGIYAIGNDADGNTPLGIRVQNILGVSAGLIAVDKAYNSAIDLNTCHFSANIVQLESCYQTTASSSLIRCTSASANIKQIKTIGRTVNVGVGNNCGIISPPPSGNTLICGQIIEQSTTTTSGTGYKYRIGAIATKGLIISDGLCTAADIFANGYDVSYMLNGRHASPSAAALLGSWVRGDFAFNTAVAEAGTTGSKYAIVGWTRITTGSNNVVGTDWLQARVLTGN